MSFFSFFDVSIFWIYLVVILGIGIHASRSVKTLNDYSLGGAKYSAFFVFATLSASFIGGGFTMGLSESVFKNGLIYVVALWGFSLKEILVAKFIAPRMGPFKGAISVGDIMGQLYGKAAKTFTGIAGALVCAGIAGAQFSAFGYIAHILIGIPQEMGVIVGALVVVFYSTLGGMKSVVINDTIHFCVLIISLPLVLFFGINYVGGFENLFNNLPATHHDIFTSLSPLALFAIFLSFFFGETLVPPYVQRLLIGKTLKETARGTLWSGLLSIPFFLMIGIIGLIALTMSPTLNPNLSLPYVIQNVMPLGFKGLAIAGIMAVLMSSADSFLNAASISAIHDGLKGFLKTPLHPQIELRFTRIATFLMGMAGALFALRSASVIDVLLYAYNFWTPFILVPLVAGILGYKSSPKTFWIASFAGVIGMVGWKLTADNTGVFDAAIAGIGLNFLTFVLLNRSEKSKIKAFANS
ncbi:Sodium:solute symporter family protein [Candidatus Bealeia paramacronuclearis]|uniref:Sodium:solute symporter family protein n=1 Tax=Candidatus Bealeia paramacronuclearis TaxID=1921001 RepID=A0ABZ2C342_9PROT|nr:Sodium:solute symporter family protein [Candidatus Bealeia paramacronuclearis]